MTKPQTPPMKPVFALITPDMSRERVKRNLVDALLKSGFSISDKTKEELGILEEGGSDE